MKFLKKFFTKKKHLNIEKREVINLHTVNHRATTRNAEQTEEICETTGWEYTYAPGYSSGGHISKSINDPNLGEVKASRPINKGSLTLDQCLINLEEFGADHRCHHHPNADSGEGWYLQSILLAKSSNPYDLTAMQNALINLLERMKNAGE